VNAQDAANDSITATSDISHLAIFARTVEGKRKEVGRCRRGGEKPLGPDVVFPAPPALHFRMTRYIASEHPPQMQIHLAPPSAKQPLNPE